MASFTLSRRPVAPATTLYDTPALPLRRLQPRTPPATRWRDQEEELSSVESPDEGLDTEDKEGRVRREEKSKVVYRSIGKGGNLGGKQVNVSSRTKHIILVVVLLLIIGGGGWWAYKYGEDTYKEVEDFVIFPKVTTPVDFTSAAMGVINDVGDAFKHAFGG